MRKVSEKRDAADRQKPVRNAASIRFSHILLATDHGEFVMPDFEGVEDVFPELVDLPEQQQN